MSVTNRSGLDERACALLKDAPPPSSEDHAVLLTATGQLTDTSHLGKVRRQIARINLVIRQREIAAAESAGK